MTYRIGGCSVFYTVQSTEVTGYSAPVAADCHPAPHGEPITPTTTFGDLADETNNYEADCLASCGNAYDPPITLITAGGRAQMLVEVAYSTVSGETGRERPYEQNPFYLWGMAIRRANGIDPDEWSPDRLDLFNCVGNPPPEVVAALRDVRIEMVAVGRAGMGCRR
ncbi:hypothetical protein [Sphingosinicella terrae]|uniref:hypothetical protein n=1 Tax=Sphingosinicella terrae TaxID=2172047 RepID=UPI0013B3E44B|nr:hypothetical protein [Sphingosinicella terrae]